MSFPAEGVELGFRNHIEDVRTFLDSRHPDHYTVFNLSPKYYRSAKFHNRVSVFQGIKKSGGKLKGGKRSCSCVSCVWQNVIRWKRNYRCFKAAVVILGFSWYPRLQGLKRWKFQGLMRCVRTLWEQHCTELSLRALGSYTGRSPSLQTSKIRRWSSEHLIVVDVPVHCKDLGPDSL